MSMDGGKSSVAGASFCEQKEAKKLYDSVTGSEAPALPHHQARIKNSYAGLGFWHSRCHPPAPDSKKFLRAFFKKHCFSLSIAP
jgi:hypothetical protein